MTALLMLRRGGDVVGRCDAACYDAEHEPCTCVCAGANHRAGIEAATANTRRWAAQWVERARGEGWRIDQYERTGPAVQEGLW